MAAEPDQKWCVWNATTDRRANVHDLTQRQANEVAADFSHEERSSNFVARPVPDPSATPDLLSELSAADHLRSSWALAELCKRAAAAIREMNALAEKLRFELEVSRHAPAHVNELSGSLESVLADLVVARRDADQWARAFVTELEAHEATKRQLQSALDAPRAASKPAAPSQPVASALDALVSALDHTRPHTREDHPGIVRAIDGLVVARIAEWAAGEGGAR